MNIFKNNRKNPISVDKTDKVNVQTNVLQQNSPIQKLPQKEMQKEPLSGNTPNGGAVNTSEFQIPKKTKTSKIPFMAAILFLLFIVIVAVVAAVTKKDGGVIVSGKTEIVWWGLGNDESIYKPLIEEYQEINKDVEIKYLKQSTQDYRERLTNSINKGQGPDIFRMHNTWVPMLVDYLDRMPQSIMTTEEYTSMYYPCIVRDMNILKDFVGVPLEYDAITLYVNEDLFAAGGKTIPSTWDEVKDIAIALTTRNNRLILQSGASLGETLNVDYWQEILALLLLQNGVDLSNPGAKSKAAADAFIYYTQFSKSQKNSWSDIMPHSTKAFAQGKVAMFFGPASAMDSIIDEKPTFRYRTYPLPQVRKNDPDFPDVSYASYWVEGVSNNSAKKEVAWDFLKFLSSKESLLKINQNAINLGKGTEFVYPRIDMASLQIEDPVIGSIVALAPYAKTWYLASNTGDGEKGINTQMTKVYQSSIEPIKNNAKSAPNVILGLSQKIPPILSQYQATIR